MKVVRGIFSGIFGIVLFGLIFALSFSYILKSVVSKDLLNGVLKQQILDQYNKEVNTEVKESIEELLGRNDISELANDILEEYAKFAKDKDYKVSDEFVDEIIDFCVKNKDIISRITKEEVTEEKLRSDETRTNLTKSLNEALPEISDKIGESGDIVMFVYGVIVSRFARIMTIFAIVTIILLIALITWSVYKWLTPLGISLIISGLLYIGLYICIMIFKAEILYGLDIDIKFNPTIIVIIGGAEFIFGIISLVIKKIIDNNRVVEENYNI